MKWHDHESSLSFFQEGLRLMARCPLCQARYQPSLVKVIAEKEDAYLVHVLCNKCHSAVVAMVFANLFGVNSVGVLTDLGSDEVLPAQQRTVQADDILELYKICNNGLLDEYIKA